MMAHTYNVNIWVADAEGYFNMLGTILGTQLGSVSKTIKKFNIKSFN